MKIRLNLHFLSYVYVFFAFCQPILAAENNSNKTSNPNQSANTKLFDSDIFSLSKKEESAFDSSSSTYVLNSNDIRRSGATSIAEALRLVPGLQVAIANNGTWAISSRGFNAQYSNKLLVMIDGRTIYTPLFSGTFWGLQDYVLEDIDRIEVIKGSGGAIWGANAVNGVINIITKNATLTQGAYLSALAGNHDKAILEARLGAKTNKNDHYRVYAKESNTNEAEKLNTGLGNGDEVRNSRAGFRYDIRSIESNKISFHGDAYHSRTGRYFATQNAANGELNNQDAQGGNLVLNWDKTLSKKSNFTFQSYFDYNAIDMNILKVDISIWDFDFQHFYNFSDRNQFIWGVGYRLIDDQIKESPNTNGILPISYDPDKKRNEIYSSFIQDKIGLIPDKLYLTLGSKFEHNDYTGFEYQPSAKLALYPSDNQTLWTSVSRTVRTPTRGEDGITLRAGSTAPGVVANQGSHFYDAEHLIAYELGYRIEPTRKILFDISTFFNSYDNMRTFEGSNATADNLGYGESHGLEIVSKWQVTDDWRLEAGYDYLQISLHIKGYSTDSSSLALELAEGQSPKNQFRLRSNYNITPKIEFDNMLYYVDSLPLSKASTDSKGVPSYIRFDTRISYLPNENIELSLVGQNLTKNKHQEFNAALYNNKTEVGRAFYFKVALSF